MKKMGLLIALATVLTVGGVYASWHYSSTTGVTEEHPNKIGVTLENQEGDQQAGTLTSVATLNLTIDQLDNNYNGVLKCATGDKVEYTFEAATFAAKGWKDDVVFNWKVEIESNAVYKKFPVLVAGSTTFGDSGEVGVDDNTRIATYTLAGSQITDAVKFNEAIQLPTPEDHKTLSDILTSSPLQIKITCTVETGVDA